MLCKPFQKRYAFARACTHTHAKAFRSLINKRVVQLLTTDLYYFIAYVGPRYVPILMLQLYRLLSLIIKLKLDSKLI